MGVLDPLFKKARQEWMEQCRVTARHLLRRRRYITIEDVLKECPRPKWVHRNTTGFVFRTSDFRPAGSLPSVRPEMNGRYVKVWALAKKKK